MYKRQVLTLIGVGQTGKEKDVDSEGNGGVKESNAPVAHYKTYPEKIYTETSYLPGEIMREGGNKTEFIGLAAFRGEHLVGYLNGTETRFYQMITNKFRDADFTISDPEEEEKAIIVKIQKRRNPTIKVDLNGEQPEIKVKTVSYTHLDVYKRQVYKT